MPAFVLAIIQQISDPVAYQRYVAQVEATLTPYSGRFIARKPDPEVLEGGPAPSRAIILQFPSVEDVRAWHASAAYQPVAALRRSASKGTLLLLPAYPPDGARVPLHDVCYVEVVSTDVEVTRLTTEAVHGWTFAAPAAELGGARTTTLANGATYAIRAPMSPDEEAVTRVYIRVPDIDAAAKRVGDKGALLALPPTPIEGRGRIAIWISGGTQHGLWEYPDA